MRRSAGRDARPALGRAAEDAACEELRRSGYRILDRNVRLAGAEIDIVAREEDTLVFVEVRSRSSRLRGSPLETVGAEKQSRIARAASAYLARCSAYGGAVRFDVVGVDWVRGRSACTLVRGAFDAPF